MKKASLFRRSFSLLLSLIITFSLFSPLSVYASNEFDDVSTADWFYDAVLWAVDQEITSGVGDHLFAPNKECTREEIVTFLWAANGPFLWRETEEPPPI